MGGGGKPDTSAFDQASQNISKGSAQTPQESAQYSGSFDIGQLLQQIFQSQMGVGQAPAGYQNPTQQFTGQSPLNQQVYNQVSADVTNPSGQYMSALQPNLDQAQNSINSYYQKRGLLNSGLAIGQMGQAGVDLAIQEAAAQNNYRQQGISNALGLSQNIAAGGQQNLSNLFNLYGQQQSAGQQSMGRQAQGAQTAAQYQTYPAQAALGDYYGNKGALGGGIGSALGGIGGLALGAALAPATGGLSLAIPMAGASIGAGAGGMLGRQF